MSLLEALGRRGYSFRQHLPEESWTRRALTVVDLDDDQCAALERGGVQGLTEALDAVGRWSFPATDVDEPAPIRRDVVLAVAGEPAASVIVPDSSPVLGLMADEWVEAVARRFGVRLPRVDDRDACLALLESQDVVVFGGSHESRFALDLALRFQTGFVDAAVPGDGGWVATTHVGLGTSFHNVTQVTASQARRDDAMACLHGALVEQGNRVLLRHVHRVAPGPELGANLPDWATFAASLPRRLPQLQGKPCPTILDPVGLADVLRVGLDSGGPDKNLYNRAPLDIAVQSAQYYQLTGDTRALRLFRELLVRLADYYLKTPDGASYPADMDFSLGHVVLYYTRLEHESVFSSDDRVILTNLLLACARSVYEYTMEMWPVEPHGPTRHNHETFAACSLLFAVHCFSRYGVADEEAWLERVDAVFSGGIWRRYKQCENANHYEQLAFEHAAMVSAFTGNGLGLFDAECLKWAATRPMITTDNLFRPVDYGDAGVGWRGAAADLLARLVTGRWEEPELGWYAAEALRRRHHYLQLPMGLRTDAESRPPAVGAWEVLPLDPAFVEEVCPGFPREYAFDKLAFRTGWVDDAHFVLFEGVGNASVSHSHNELNGITRLNHLGRHWIVSNGYGRLAGLANVAESFSTRVRGPEDHNMLVLRRDGEVVRDLPVCNALLQRGQVGDLGFATGALLSYGGTDWYRTLLLLADRFLLVIDRVHVVQSGLDGGHIEWNCLGSASLNGGCFHLEQQGVGFDVLTDSTWCAELGVADRSADWQAVLGGGAYPFATFPLAKLTYRMPDAEPGQSTCLVTLLASSRSGAPGWHLRSPRPGHVCVEAPTGVGPLPKLDMASGDLSAEVDEGSLEVHFADIPDLPDALRPWSATSHNRGLHTGAGN